MQKQPIEKKLPTRLKVSIGHTSDIFPMKSLERNNKPGGRLPVQWCVQRQLYLLPPQPFIAGICTGWLGWMGGDRGPPERQSQ